MRPEPATSAVSLPTDRVDVWLARPAGAGPPPRVADWLNVEERRRADELVRPTARTQRLTAYAARRAVLSFYAPYDPGAWRFVVDAHGRPELVAAPGMPRLRLSLSHTEGLVAVAVAHTADVGVDVDRIDPRRRALDIAERCFAPEEMAALLAAPVEARPALFATFWTLKESYLKARGVGIWGGVDLQACRFELADDRAEVRFRPAPAVEDHPEAWRFFAIEPTAVHRAAIAVRNSGVASPKLAAFMVRDGFDAFDPIAVMQR